MIENYRILVLQMFFSKQKIQIEIHKKSFHPPH